MLLEYLYFTRASDPLKTSVDLILSQQRGNAHLLTTTPYRSILAAGYKTHKWSESHSVVSNSSWPHGLYSPWNSQGQNTGVGSLSLLQGIFPTLPVSCPSHTSSPHWQLLVCSLHLWVCVCFVIFTSLYYLLDPTYKWYHTVFVFPCLTCFT